MKFIKTIGLTCLLLTLAALTISPPCLAEMSGGTTTAADVKQETADLLKALKSYTIEQRDEAVRKTAAALAKLDQRIDVLETRIDKNWDKMDQAARENARASLKELRRQRTIVAEWYGSLKSSSAGAWEHMKEGFSDAYKSLQEAWIKSQKEFSADK